MIFYVYVDWTLEEFSRPFYVGKGNKTRTRVMRRNDYHNRITGKYGQRREIVLMTSVEHLALEHEVNLIAEFKTQTGMNGHWGANMTAGGEGLSNPSPEIRQRLSISQRNKAADSELTRYRKSQSAKRLGEQSEIRANRSRTLKGHVKTDVTCAKISVAKRKPVDQLDLHGNVIASFASALHAQDTTKVWRSKICECCKGRRDTAGGYRWRYRMDNT